jgi:hypothetical protein
MGGLDGFEARWVSEVPGIIHGLAEWRRQHPRASFREIEAALDEQLTAMRAGLLQDLALASAAAEQAGRPEAERAACPHCGERLAPRGKHRRTILTQGNQPVQLEREYAVCPACGVGLFPPR